MEHKEFAAATTATDTEQGTFTALVSAWDADREGDTIAPDAFDKTIAAWQQSGKQLPLLYSHSTAVVGAVDPFSMRPTEAGLVVAGEVDRSTEKGQEVWRSIKANTAGFSVGFMSEGRPRKGGGRLLTQVDLLEVSWTPTPMNASTRALSWKTADRSLSPVAQEMAEILGAAWDTAMADPDATLRAKAVALGVDEIARQAQAVQIASFDC